MESESAQRGGIVAHLMAATQKDKRIQPESANVGMKSILGLHACATEDMGGRAVQLLANHPVLALAPVRTAG